MPTRRLGQARHRETILECIVHARPHVTNYWQRDDQRISTSDRHAIDVYYDDYVDGRLTLNLRINDVTSSNYGDYQCTAENGVGRDQQTMQLFGKVKKNIVVVLVVESF